ncbi:hypothetical protein [Clostridium sardiniense]|uniref:hypothetical protein n=1 Tax=Clostridium sardiniense TaxID=29369 RepID=UPI003D32EDE1
MNIDKAKDIIKSEKDHLGEDYTNITFSINDIMEFEEGTDIKTRYFVKNIKILDKYMEMLDQGENKLNKKKKVLFFTVNEADSNEINNVVNGVLDYKKKYENVIEKLRCCSKCQCLSCLRNCPFHACLSCGKSGRVTECDKEKYNITMFENTYANLYNSEINAYDSVEVLAQVDILTEKTSFRVINSNGDFLILTYIHDMQGKDNYGAVNDKEVFNFIADLYERNVEDLV